MIELTRLIKFIPFAEFFINQSTIQLNQPPSLRYALRSMPFLPATRNS
jgi:hypothetical protein